jgi:hypothetical protein
MKRYWLTVVVAACLAPLAVAQTDPAYLKIKLSDKGEVYLQFQKNMLRMAATPEGLATAEPVKAKLLRGVRSYLGVPLPISKELLPKKFDGAGIHFAQQETRSGGVFGNKTTTQHAVGEVYLTARDAKEVEWSYSFRVDQELSASPTEKVPVIAVDVSDGLKADVGVVPEGRILKVGLRVMAGVTEVNQVLHQEKPASVAVTVLDQDGKELESKKGMLSDFGFS